VFDLYGVFVLLVDAKGEILHFAAGTGKAGEYLLLQHSQVRLDSERSLVAKAARTRQIVVVNDVSLEPLYVAMPEMPETRSEIVIPLVVGDRLLGVLDIEHHETNRFKEDDVRAFSSLADQIAIAVQNAHLYADQVKVAEELRETDRMKSQFLASMSHELRTPLNAILNFSKFLKMGVYGEINTEQTEALNNVLISSEHLLDLINDVLDVAKIEAGMLQLFVEDKISLEPDVNSVIATAKTLVRDKPITLIEEIDPDLPLVVGDRRRIKQILLNLVSNACKFTRKGSITIRVKREGENVCFAVIDTGPGISETDQASIFEPFEQSKDGLKQGGGTGLGLAIASKLAEAHGGNLSLESEVGVGSSFYFTLPVCAPQLLEQM
jgi:signal transduction histidine kinase